MAERLRAVTETLEAIAQDRGLLAALSVDERTRLLTAAADVHHPDIVQRRRWSKASRRREKAERLERDEAVLADAGIRLLRNKPVFTTPDPPRPAVEEQTEVEDDPAFREVVELQHCYVCKQRYLDDPSLLRPAVPLVRRLQLRQARRDGRPARPRRADHRRARQDRLPGRDQAAASRRRADRHDALPPRRSGAICPGARLRGLGRAARDLRARPAAHAERRGVLPPPQGEPAAPRLHRQQRVSDRPPPAGLLPAHARARDGISAGNVRAGARAARRLRGPSPLRHASDRTRPTAGRSRRSA